MVEGYVDIYGSPMIDLVVEGKLSKAKVPVVVDTGFNGDLCLPIPLGIDLGVQLIDTAQVELANGSVSEELVFAGRAQLGERGKPVEIYLTRSKEALIGTRLLRDEVLRIDFRCRELTIE
ncbi:MAG: hypothetical protein QME81_17920 [bacterium]|nr:hypothetical protein [bacterium]